MSATLRKETPAAPDVAFARDYSFVTHELRAFEADALERRGVKVRLTLRFRPVGGAVYRATVLIANEHRAVPAIPMTFGSQYLVVAFRGRTATIQPRIASGRAVEEFADLLRASLNDAVDRLTYSSEVMSSDCDNDYSAPIVWGLQ